VSDLHYVLAPQESAGDDHVRLVEWSIADGSQVSAGTLIALAETTKASFEIAAEASGYLFHLVGADDRVKVGEPIAVISPVNVRPEQAPAPASSGSPAIVSAGNQTFTRKAAGLIEQHGISPDVFAGMSVVRQADVEAYLAAQRGPASRNAQRFFAGEALDPDADWDAALASEELRRLTELTTALRRRLKARFNRHVPLGTLVHDRWAVAKEYGFGEGTSVYDECLILGDVTVGRHCWIGPFTVLDGNFAAIRIGDHTCLGTGAHIYSHHAIDNILTKGAAPVHAEDTEIGSGCFISPLSIIGPGSRIGDQSFVASGSFVQGVFPALSYIAGTPGRRVGRVEIRHQRVFLRKED